MFPHHFLYLNTPGGDLQEAMLIGDWIRRTGFRAIVPKDGVCASACVFVLAAGTLKYPWGEVEIHRFYLAAAPPEGVRGAMHEILASAKRYMREMNIPDAIVEEMFSIPPESSKVLSESELSFYRLNAYDMELSEELALRKASRLAISRDELVRRQAAYSQSREQAACHSIPEDRGIEFVTCINSALERYGLK